MPGPAAAAGPGGLIGGLVAAPVAVAGTAVTAAGSVVGGVAGGVLGGPAPAQGMTTDAQKAQILAQLSAMPPGPQYDATFVNASLQGHREALGIHGAYAQSGEDPGLRAIARGALPLINLHIARLSRMQAMMGSQDGLSRRTTEPLRRAAERRPLEVSHRLEQALSAGLPLAQALHPSEQHAADMGSKLGVSRHGTPFDAPDCGASRNTSLGRTVAT